MGRVCTICSHAKRYEIEGLLATRQSTYRGIARTYGVEQSELISKLDTFATKKKESMTELVRQQPRQPYRKYTQEEMIEALEESKGLIAPAARALGCSRDTIRSYLEEYAAVAQAKLDQREAVTDMAENSLYEAIRRGEAWAVCFYLKCMAKNRGYIEKAEVSVPGGKPISIKLVYDE